MSLSWKKLFLDEFVSKGHCGLCANHGIIDTRGIRTPAGFECGDLFWCICPNGRALKRVTKQAKPDFSNERVRALSRQCPSDRAGGA